MSNDAALFFVYLCKKIPETMKRSEFLKLCGGFALAVTFSHRAVAALKNPSNDGVPKLKLDIRPLKLNVGATKPFKALHISDTHFTRVGEGETMRKVNVATARQRIFPWAEHYFDMQMDYAREHNLMILHTGDLNDLITEANLKHVALQTKVGDWICAPGNHDFSQFVGEAWEDEAYKAQSYDKVNAVFPNELTFDSRVINGVNFVSLMNGYYYVTEYQAERMKEEVKRGLPIVLLCHVPFYTPKHCEQILKGNKNYASYMAGTPREITSSFRPNPNVPKDHWRQCSIQQHASDTTLEFLSWLKKQPELKAILCGHVHHFFEEQFSPTAVQYAVGAGYMGAAYEIEFV